MNDLLDTLRILTRAHVAGVITTSTGAADKTKLVLTNNSGKLDSTVLPGLESFNGKSAYELAVDNGYPGSLEEWLDSLIGPRGLTGNVGATGVIGPTGLKGNTGVQGIRGYTGPIGHTGITGVTGEIGPTGAQGITGPVGHTGIRGYTGARGVTGNVGPTGPIGVRGFTGNRGLTGLRGPTGPRGLTGIKGDTGDIGATGPLGDTGPMPPVADDSDSLAGTNNGVYMTPLGVRLSKSTVPIFTYTSTTYFTSTSEGGALALVDCATPCTLTIPANSSVPFPVGTQIIIAQVGAGAVTVSCDDTLTTFESKATTAGPGAMCSAIKTAATSWLLGGNLIA